MALVAYSDESDISDLEDDIEPPPPIRSFTSQRKLPSEASSDSTSIPIKSQLKKPASSLGIESIVDEDEELENINANSRLLSSLPVAEPISDITEFDLDTGSDVVDDVPTLRDWKITKDINESAIIKDATASKKNKIKFILPSLSEYEEKEEENKSESSRIKMKSSSSGTGLFSLLPSPKAVTEPHQLVPLILKRPKQAKPETKPKKVKLAPVRCSDDSDDEFDSTVPTNFFSLIDAQSHADSHAPNTNHLININLEVTPTGTNKMKVEPSVCGSDFNSGIISNPTNDAMVGDYTNVSYNPNPCNHNMPSDNLNIESCSQAHFQEINDTPSTNSIGRDALIRLAGKRNKDEIINLVDIKADDALMPREEWVAKALTEEKPTHSYSKKKEGMPSHQQRRKHQIIYLAHQAKERELELKNSWSENRLTKMQTRAKYGF